MYNAEQIQALIDKHQKQQQYRKEYNQRPEVAAKRKEYMAQYAQQEHVKAKRKEYNKERYALIKELMQQHKDGV